MERARITESGWVGIGTSAPSRLLDVNGQSRFRLKVQCESLLEASMLKITWLSGGAGILKVDASGNVNKILYTGNASDVLTGAGTFTSLNTLLPSPLWQQNTSGIFYNGNVGINKNNPQYALDITGDLNVSHNVYVGGGVVIAQRADLDTADFGGGRIAGNGSAVEVIGDLRAQNKLEVVGNAEIAGNLKLSNLSSFVGNTLNLIVADPNGNLKVLGPGPVGSPSIACPTPLNPVSSPMWLVGGQQLNPSDCNYLGSINNVSMSIGVNTHHIINLTEGVYNNNIPKGKVGINTAPPPGKEISMEIYGSLSIINGGDVSLYLGRNNLIGSNTVAEEYGEWGIQYLRSISNNGNPGGLNFWKPSQSTGVSGNGFLFLSDNGNVGINNLNPHCQMDIHTQTDKNGVCIKTDHTQDYGFGVLSEVNRPYTKGLSVILNDGNNPPKENFVVYGNGFVGIGTNNYTCHNPNIKLAVNGHIKAKEIVVELSGWCDYRLKDDFKRMAWKEKEEFIRKHSHLPEMESEEELGKEGVSVFKTIKGILANTEDNTMETIELYKEIQKLKNEIKKLKEKLNEK